MLIAIRVGGVPGDRRRGGAVAGRRHPPRVESRRRRRVPRSVQCPTYSNTARRSHRRPRQGRPACPAVETGERLARADLRRQIGRLERALGETFASAFPRRGLEWGVGAVGGPRVLSTGELERVRDALAARLRDARAELGRRADVEEANRTLLESMIAAPEEHRWVIVSNEDIGEPGCRHWHVAPALGDPRDALQLVADPPLLGLSVSHGASAPGRRGHAPELMAKKRRKPRPRRPPSEPASEAAPAPTRRQAAARSPASRSRRSARRRPGARSRSSSSSSSSPW